MMRASTLTLSAVVVDVRVVGVVPDGSLKVTESTGSVAELHVDASDLYPALNKVGLEVQALLQILLGSLGITDQELESTAEVVGFSLAFGPADAVLDRLVDERDGVCVIGSVQGIERERKCLVALRRGLGEGRLGVCFVS